MKDRPADDHWYRFEVGDRVEGIPTSAPFGGERGTVLGYCDSNNVLVFVKFDSDLLNGAARRRPVVVSLLKHLSAIDRLGELGR